MKLSNMYRELHKILRRCLFFTSRYKQIASIPRKTLFGYLKNVEKLRTNLEVPFEIL